MPRFRPSQQLARSGGAHTNGTSASRCPILPVPIILGWTRKWTSRKSYDPGRLPRLEPLVELRREALSWCYRGPRTGTESSKRPSTARSDSWRKIITCHRTSFGRWPRSRFAGARSQGAFFRRRVMPRSSSRLLRTQWLIREKPSAFNVSVCEGAMTGTLCIPREQRIRPVIQHVETSEPV